MQSVQLPNVGILLSKKGKDGEGAEVVLKAFVKYLIHRKSHQMIKWNSDSGLLSRFRMGM
ncbi:MAG: hypothetical protein CL868_14200 [Cytophagaceae bacterium]|nr:hypothetical protein [Cytophagaceae bacterium]